MNENKDLNENPNENTDEILNDNPNENENENVQPSEECTEKKPNAFIRALKTLGRWGRRFVFGGSNGLYREQKERERLEREAEENTRTSFDVEKIESPGKQRLKAFFSRKLAVVALVLLICMFIVMFVGPLFFPLDLAYVEPTQSNASPGLNMMSVPKELRSDIVSISSSSKFSVGLSGAGKVYVWGNTKLLTTDMDEIPEEVKSKKILHAAAGRDHIIAIAEDGTVYGWGQSSCGQYGPVPEGNPQVEFLYTFAPKVVLDGELDPTQIKQLVCGNQVTAIVMNDGKLYMWGNHSSGALNMASIKRLTNVEKLVFTNDVAVVLLKDGTYSTAGTEKFDDTYIMKDGVRTRVKLAEHIESLGQKVVDIAAADNTIAVLLENGQVVMSGTYTNGEDLVPSVGSGEKITSVYAGMKHFTAVTDKGKAYSWGSNTWKQTNVPSKLSGVSEVFTGPFQNYAVNKDGELVGKWGLKGYLMGTDGFGRDIWTRIVNGGRLTMTIGAISVIISSIIGIIVGCLSGYFGGWVDMLLMRVAEIVSAIPFLPFALILSLVASSMGLEEMTRITMIMIILGLLSWTGLARLVRGQVLAEREKEFVTAAKAMGVKEWKIAFKHILPNVISIIIVSMTLDFAGCMLTESSLSYLGFGVRLPRPTWGNMLDGANNSIVIQNYWWQWVFPSLFLMATTICINIIGDALRDVMDPKSSAGR